MLKAAWVWMLRSETRVDHHMLPEPWTIILESVFLCKLFRRVGNCTGWQDLLIKLMHYKNTGTVVEVIRRVDSILEIRVRFLLTSNRI